MRCVILESPYAGRGWGPLRWWRTWQNVRYARRCVRHALQVGDAPIASHLLYTQRGILRDDVPAERAWGIVASMAWREKAETSVAYIDRGISAGMEEGLKAAHSAGARIEFRAIDPSSSAYQNLDKVREVYALKYPAGIPGFEGLQFFTIDDKTVRAVMGEPSSFLETGGHDVPPRPFRFTGEKRES